MVEPGTWDSHFTGKEGEAQGGKQLLKVVSHELLLLRWFSEDRYILPARPSLHSFPHSFLPPFI